MNYKKHYDLLIERAKTRQLTGYVERHHIVPRCIGGTNEKTNLVELTPEEHYVAHQLLVKMYPENDSLVYAANKMTVSSKTIKRNNKRYGWLKRRYQSVCKKRVGKRNASYGRSWYHDPATLENGKFLSEDVPAGWVKGRTPETKDRHCRNCNVYVDNVSKNLNSTVLCNSCKKDKRSKKAKQAEKYNYNLIKQIYKEHKLEKIGYYTLAQKYNINKWTIYDYIGRYKEDLKKEFGV
jgi:hypothetical protein